MPRPPPPMAAVRCFSGPVTSRLAARLLALSAGAAFLLAVGVGASPLAAQDAPILVSTDWLAEELGDAQLAILHVGNEASFQEAHIPGAQLMLLPSFAPEVDGLSTEMPDPAVFREVLEAAGVSSDSRIVVYSATTPSPLAARFYLTLEHFGLGGNASLLDGALTTWQEEGRQTSQTVTEVARGSLPELRPGTGLLTDHAFVSARVADGGAAIVDARDTQFWTGTSQNQQRAARAGRVPGAANVPFRTVVDDSGRMLGADELRALFDEAGVEAGAPVVAYCHVGQQASLLVIAARLLGHEAFLYDGSYEDWAQRLDLPVEVE